MKLNDIREGNYVKEFEYSSRGRALEPFYRVEYDDLGYWHFMVGIPITLEWCKKLGMDTEEVIPHATGANFDRIAEKAGLKIRGFKGGITVFHSTGGCTSILEHIKYVHQLQNFYYGYWGFEIDEENPTEYYQEPKNE
jgi:hypothetical protein